MGTTLKALMTGEDSVDVEFAGQSITVKFCPGKITQETVDGIGNDETLLAFLADVVIQWDIYKDNSKKNQVPATVKEMQKLPLPFMRMVLEEVLSYTGKEAAEEGKGSLAG